MHALTTKGHEEIHVEKGLMFYVKERIQRTLGTPIRRK